MSAAPPVAEATPAGAVTVVFSEEMVMAAAVVVVAGIKVNPDE
jgi:hypothetical protein